MGPVSGVTATSATFEGTLNPGASAKAGWYFFYSTEISCLIGQGATGQEPEVEGQALAEHVEVTGLQPSKTYRVCMVATNEAGESTPSANEVSFTTLGAPPAVEGETTSGVSSTAATLEGQVNPNNQVSSCVIEYGTTNAYGTKAPCEPASLEGFGNQRAALSVTGLTPGTTYHFRIVAENASKEKTDGPDQSFTTVPTPNTDPVGAVTARTATFNGHLTLNPVDTQYSFEYKVGTECTGESMTPTEDAGSGSGTLSSPAVPVTGLIPATQYSVCLVASNVYGAAQGPVVSFVTPSAEPTITGESSSEVTATSARLKAEVDPGGAETTYHFEYDTSPYTTSAPHGQRTPESASIGADNSLHTVTAAIQGLQPDTTYYYRVGATNSQSPAGGMLGPDRTFTTQTTGGVAALPDGRAFELVSPPQKDGAEILGIGGVGQTPTLGDATQASEDGTSVTYIANAPVGSAPPGNVLSTQIFSTRGANGWSSRDISTPHKHPIPFDKLLSEGEEYLRFSSSLARAILVPLHVTFEPSLAPEVHQEVAGETEIYLRDDITNTFRALVTVEPLPVQTTDYEPPIVFEGATPDLSHVAFGGPAGLDPTRPSAGGLYEWADGHTQLVSVLPKGEAASGLALLASQSRNVNGLGEPIIAPTQHAISDDGTRVVWSGEGALFTRDTVTGETVQVDAARGGKGADGGGVFQGASSDGSRVFFTDTSELINGASAGDLFMFDLTSQKLTDLTPDGDEVQSFLGANEEGTSLYEVSPTVLTSAANPQGEHATAGANNTYLLRETPVDSGSWTTTFIAAGAEEGKEDFNNGAPFSFKAARVSPNGRFLAFMSGRSLTGYDNRDANSGEPDMEVYLYDANANRLVCASCDPTGARPIGQFDHERGAPVAIDRAELWNGRWVAATIPGWTGAGFDRSSGHQPGYLTDSGRLFFNSAGGLVPHDVNGRADVYEFEPAGVGSCQSPSYGQGASVVFSKALEACIGLISGGTGNGDSLFFDASASGNDVFFTTQDGLAQQDVDGTSDMYDARVCTSAAPCPSSLAISPACTTTDSCRVAPSPQPGVFAAPASATFAGAGNATPGPALAVEVKRRAKTVAQIRAEKLSRALKACKGMSGRRRVRCEVLAKKRYGKPKTSGRRIK